VKKSTSSPGIAAAGLSDKTNRKRVGQVSPQERDEMKATFERKNALVELFKTLADSDHVKSDLYEKLVVDLGKTTTRHSEWWAAMSKKYQWESTPDGRWEIDFDDCSIYLVRPA
jgi:CXXX repeat modification system protein